MNVVNQILKLLEWISFKMSQQRKMAQNLLSTSLEHYLVAFTYDDVSQNSRSTKAGLKVSVYISIPEPCW